MYRPLILHGTDDRVLPPEATARRQVGLLRDARLIELEDGPHGVLWTHAEQTNEALVEFLA